jgi:hypothetical protein
LGQPGYVGEQVEPGVDHGGHLQMQGERGLGQSRFQCEADVVGHAIGF